MNYNSVYNIYLSIEYMAEQIFTSLSMVLGIVLISTMIMKLLKQPMIIGYIIAGTVISLCIPGLLHTNTAFQSFGNLGISLLLFMVGMELSPTIIKDLWKTSLIAGMWQVIITTILWFLTASVLWFDTMTALFLAIGFAFSSTIVVLKLIGDKDEMEFTYGRLSVGILIVQDIMVMLLMIGMATLQSIQQGGQWLVVGGVIIKMIVSIVGIWAISKYIIPKITKKIAESQEYLFLFSIGRCFILWSVFYRLGFGIEIGALIAGITLANSAYRFEITSRIKPLKDFFLVIFFVLLWSHVDFANLHTQNIRPLLVCALFILIIKPLITMIFLGICKHTRKNSFLTGISLWQMSEFSFIVITMGIQAWYIQDPTILSITTLLGLISIAGSSYFIMYGEKLYHICKSCIGWIPWVWTSKQKKVVTPSYEITIFGYGRFGSNIYELLKKTHNSILIVDENPAIINHLQDKKIACMYGDMSDIDFLETLNLKKGKMIISTIKNFDENMVLLKTSKQYAPNMIIIVVANHIQEAIKLYEQGADYVILPHYIGVDHTSLMLEEYGFDINKFMENKKTLVDDLKNRNQDLMIETLHK